MIRDFNFLDRGFRNTSCSTDAFVHADSVRLAELMNDRIIAKEIHF
jgi:hypothetical protein